MEQRQIENAAALNSALAGIQAGGAGGRGGYDKKRRSISREEELAAMSPYDKARALISNISPKNNASPTALAARTNKSSRSTAAGGNNESPQMRSYPTSPGGRPVFYQNRRRGSLSLSLSFSYLRSLPPPSVLSLSSCEREKGSCLILDLHATSVLYTCPVLVLLNFLFGQ